jgi:hypothetical protein
MRRLKVGVKHLFGWHFPGHNLRVFPDDVFLVSYPKSGNTWTRFLVANLAYPEKSPDFSNINNLIPDPEGMSKRNLERSSRPRILKSHHCFDPRFQKVIYVVRDPRDVVVSEYHYDIKRRALAEDYPLPQFVSRFVRGELNHPYGTWGENAASWFYTRRGDPRFLLVKYEALEAQPTVEMGRVADFLGIPGDRERLAFAIEQSSARRMRELEKKQAHLWSSTRETRKDKPFVRAAKSGGWKADLCEASIAEIESAWGGIMRDLSYELVGLGLVVDGGTSNSAGQKSLL